MVNFILIIMVPFLLSSPAISANWNQGSGEKYSNDFSESIYKDWSNWNTTGPHPSAAKLENGKLVITITEEMLDTHSDRTGRFELEKQNISKSLAVYQKFKIRSLPENIIGDRVVVSQIKQFDKNGSGQPQATVNLDRAPTCAIYSHKKELKDFPVGKREELLPSYNPYSIKDHVYWRTYKKKSWYYTEFRKTPTANLKWSPLGDGEWHTVEMDVYPHSKNGYCIIKVDGKVWINLQNAPTRSLGGGNFRYAARIGIYRDAVGYSHTVEFDDWEVETYKPETGLKIQIEN